MKTKIIMWLLAIGCGLLAACAVITINVYFPEKAAKEAYKSLDDMLLKNAPATPGAPPAPDQPAPMQPEKPQSQLIRFPHISLVSSAWAADAESDALAIEVASMPEVNTAYEEMNRRLPRLTALFDSGAVGLTNQGLVSIREKSKVTSQDEALVSAENQSRKVVVSGMARAILKITKQSDSKAAQDQVLGKAAATYAENKRDAAKPGWWIQGQNGRWLQK
ncbi:MAG: DUF1318 domain-containing protein [Desulfuromonadales bacterium]|nr:DUF1318 domain-containing protein [Desulfuromonadales bacterium]